MNVTLYIRPNGNTKEIYVENVDPEDREWFETNNVSVSMEEMVSGMYAIWAHIGNVDEDGEPLEEIYLTRVDQTCNDAMKQVRAQCEKAMARHV